MMRSRPVKFGGAVLVTLIFAAVTTGCSRIPTEPSASDCPSLLPGTRDALDDYFDMLIWKQRTYVADQELAGEDLTRPQLERRVATITCNVYEWSAENGGLRAAPRPWPDGTATGLDVGTTVHRLQGLKVECALGARNAEGDIRVFVAVDLDSEGSPTLCA